MDVADPARPARSAPLGGITSYAIGLAFTPDSQTLAVGSADKTVHLWNVANPAHPVLLGAPLTGPSGYAGRRRSARTARRSRSASPTAPSGCGWAAPATRR